MFYVNSIFFQFFLSLFLFISFIFSDEIIIDKPQIKEKIIKETYYGYHHLRAASASKYKFFSVGLPGLPLKPLHEIIRIFTSNLLSSLSL